MLNEAAAWRLTASLAGALMAAFLAPAPVYASAWQRLYSTADRSVDIQLAGIHRQDEVVLSWVRFSFVKDQHDPSARAYRSMLQQWAYQCTARRHALVRFAEFSDGAGAGTLVAADSRDHYEWSSPEPDSLGAVAMKVACAHDLDTSDILKRKAAKQL
jgi:hypothetical protein